MMVGGSSVFLFLFLSAVVITLFAFIGTIFITVSRRREREAFYRSDTIKKIAEQGPGSDLALEFLREQDKIASRRRIEGMKIGGLITTAVGVSSIIFLSELIKDEPIYLEGLIPLFVGLALLVYAYLLAPKV